MLQTARSIFSLMFFLWLVASTTSCSLMDPVPDPAAGLHRNTSKQKVYYANYDLVWKSIHAILKYPIAIDNQDTGIIETEYIKTMDGFAAPESAPTTSSGSRYKIVILVAKGKTEGREATRVTIDKQVEVLKDFFSEPKSLESDGLEEKVLFYRIEREIVISEALKKVN